MECNLYMNLISKYKKYQLIEWIFKYEFTFVNGLR